LNTSFFAIPRPSKLATELAFYSIQGAGQSLQQNHDSRHSAAADGGGAEQAKLLIFQQSSAWPFRICPLMYQIRAFR
jgi:hypothetical protein